MIDAIFSALPDSYIDNVIDQPLVFYFSLGDTKKTVHLTRNSCLVEEGKTVEIADCVCKTDADFFLTIWNDGYRPGMGDFLSAKIKSNNPSGLQLFLKAFGKD